MAPALMGCWIEGGAGFILFSVLPGGAVELPGRSRPAPGVSTFAGVGLRRAFSLGFQAGAIASLSVGAWLPRAAPDPARALDRAAADFYLRNSVGGAGGGGRAMGSASLTAGLQHRGEGHSSRHEDRSNGEF